MNTRKIGNELEKYVVSNLKDIWPSARLTSNSGAVFGDGDIHCPIYYIDCKNTSRSAHTVTSSDWKKIKKQAINSCKEPVAIVKNVNGEITVTISFDSFIELLFELHGNK
jgi:hypothetical protein